MEKRTYRGHEFSVYQREGQNQSWWHWITPDGGGSEDEEGSRKFNGKDTKQAVIAAAQTHINAMIAKGAYK